MASITLQKSITFTVVYSLRVIIVSKGLTYLYPKAFKTFTDMEMIMHRPTEQYTENEGRLCQ